MAETLLGNLFGHPGSFSWPEPEILEDVFWQVIYPQNYRSACDLPQTNDQPKEDQPGTSGQGTRGCSKEAPRDFPREFHQFCKNFRRSCRRPERRPDSSSNPAGVPNQFCPGACTKQVGQCCSKRDVKKDVGEKFEVHLNLRHFKPEEIVVKLTGDNKTVIVDTKHEEREDEYGSVYRHFVRKYDIPEGHDVSKLESKLSPDGILTITAPKIRAVDSSGAINIPVIRTEHLVPEKMEESDGRGDGVTSIADDESVEEKKEADEKKSEGSDDASFMML